MKEFRLDDTNMNFPAHVDGWTGLTRGYLATHQRCFSDMGQPIAVDAVISKGMYQGQEVEACVNITENPEYRDLLKFALVLFMDGNVALQGKMFGQVIAGIDVLVDQIEYGVYNWPDGPELDDILNVINNLGGVCEQPEEYNIPLEV